jgi:polygalacturonase
MTVIRTHARLFSQSRREFFRSATAAGLMIPTALLSARLVLAAEADEAAEAGTRASASHTGAASGPGGLPAQAWMDVRKFGAKGTGKAIDTPAVNEAIAYVAARGGGVVHFPAGTYACYSIRLRSGVYLHLDSGATILAAPVPSGGAHNGGYDAAEPQGAWEPYQDYGHNHWHNSLIWAEGVHDIGIFGQGLIWGKGLRHDTGSADEFHSPLAGEGNKAIALKRCHNVLLRDVSILEGGWFALLATGVDNMTIDNVLVDTNRDGFDIDCCRNVHIKNCTVNSPRDDGICPKSSYALGYARATENITISNCYLTGAYEIGSVLDGTWKPLPQELAARATGRIKCGTESNGGFKNIAISNCVFDQCRGIALESVDGAHLEDIAISNITMRGIVNSPLFLRLGRRMRGPEGVPIGTLKRVVISNITCESVSMLPSILAGVEGHAVEDVKISEVFFRQAGAGSSELAKRQPPAAESSYPEPTMFGDLPATGFFIRHARNIEMSHVEIQAAAADERPAVWMQDVVGADFFRMRLPPGTAYALDRVAQFRSFGCRSLPDVSFDEPQTRTIRGNPSM